MEPEIFDRIPENKFYGTTTDVFPGMLEDELPIFAYWHHGYWKDVGTIQSYLDVHRDLLDGRMNGGLPLRESNLPQGHRTPPVLLGKNCKIADTAKIGPYVVLGDHCTVGENAVIEHSICWGRCCVRKEQPRQPIRLGKRCDSERQANPRQKNSRIKQHLIHPLSSSFSGSRKRCLFFFSCLKNIFSPKTKTKQRNTAIENPI